jgi:hypothetical protein
MTYQIPASNYAAFEKKLKSLTKKAKKLNLPLPTFKVLGNEVVEFSQTVPSGDTEKFAVEVVNVEVTGEAVAVDGWTFVATLTPLGDDGQTLVSTSPFYEGTVPESFRTADPARCDHCGFSRRRKDVFLLERDSDFMQVGRQCLRDFLGGTDPQVLAMQAEYMDLLSRFSDLDEDGEGFGYSKSAYPIITFLAHVIAAIEVDGWFSRAAADRLSMEQGVPYKSTGDLANEVMTASVEAQQYIDKRLFPVSRHFEAARELIEWAKEHFSSQKRLNDYQYNLSVSVATDWVHPRTLGLLASLPNYRERQVTREREAAQKKSEAVSVHLGTPKQRIPMRVRLERCIAHEGAYGTTYIQTFRTLEGYRLPEGAEVTWFGSSRVRTGTHDNGCYKHLEVGEEALVLVTVKKHDQYQGVKQTVVNRVATTTEAEAEKALKKVSRAL